MCDSFPVAETPCFSFSSRCHLHRRQHAGSKGLSGSAAAKGECNIKGLDALGNFACTGLSKAGRRGTHC